MADTPRVRTEGSGEARVLVLHGWALDSSVWAATQLETNLEEFTYAYYDFPGYGPDESLGRDSAEGIDGMARGGTVCGRCSGVGFVRNSWTFDGWRNRPPRCNDGARPCLGCCGADTGVPLRNAV